MSARWKMGLNDVKSAVRHTVIPLVSGAAMAGLEAVQVGSFQPQQAKTAVVTALIAGVIRLLQRWTLDLGKPQR